MMSRRFYTFIIVWLSVSTSPLLGQLQVIKPNGEEAFINGDTISIQWTGVTESTPVVIEFSSDNGKSWELIADRVFGNSFRWKPSSISSNQCLVRVKKKYATLIKPELLHVFSHNGGATTSATFSPDGTMLSTTGWDSTARLWDIETGKNLRTFRSTYNSSVLYSTFNADGTKLATTSLDSSIYVFDLLTGTPIQEIHENHFVWAVEFTPNGETLAVSNNDGSLTLWEIESGKSIDTFSIHNESIRKFNYTADGMYIIASSADRSASIVETETYSPIRYFDHHSEIQQSYTSREERQEAERRKTVNGIELTNDKKIAITCGFNGLIKFWDVATEKLIASRNFHHGNYVSSIDLSPDDRWIISAGYDSTAKIIDLNSYDSVYTVTYPKGRMVSAKFSPDGLVFALTHWDNTITVWKTGDCEEDSSDHVWILRSREDEEF